MHAPSGYSNQRLGRDLAIKEGIEFLAEDYRKIAVGHCQVNGTKPSFSPKQQEGIVKLTGFRGTMPPHLYQRA